jgi:hypothetical protein
MENPEKLATMGTNKTQHEETQNKIHNTEN